MAEQSKSKTVITIIVIIATLLLMVFVVREMIRYTTPPPVGAERGAARARDNAEIRAAGRDALASYGYADAAKGIVRIPIDEAMKITVEGYKTPEGFRSNLMTRLDKANVAAPKPPEKPNQYE